MSELALADEGNHLSSNALYVSNQPICKQPDWPKSPPIQIRVLLHRKLKETDLKTDLGSYVYIQVIVFNVTITELV